MPGTTEGAPGNSVVRDRQCGVALTANGQWAEHNNFMLDGTDNNATLASTAVVIPSVDALQEAHARTSLIASSTSTPSPNQRRSP